MSVLVRFARPAVLVAALGLAGCASSTSGFVDEGSEDGSPEQNLIKGMMTTMGAIDPKERPIEYKPRAPLVVPPKRTLPAPQDDSALRASNFPRNQEEVDADIAKLGSGDPDPGKVWTPEQLAKYRLRTDSRREADLYRPDPTRPLSPDELRGQHALNKQAMEAAAKSQGRSSLIQPPETYRTPSPNAPVVPEEEKSSWKPGWWPL